MTLHTEFRSLNGTWPQKFTNPRQHSRFDSPYEVTLDLLEREVNMLGATHIVIQLDLPDSKIRNDGLPRANAGDPGHPGVIVSFESKWGPLRYMTDTFKKWKDNLRAIALGLEALRKVDRYGIANDGEQYRGYAQLGSGDDAPIALGQFSPAEAAKILVDAAGGTPSPESVLEDADRLAGAYRAAARRTHPDHGGSDDAFALVGAAYRVLRQHHGLTA